jgi:hypothetical protein
LIVGNEDLREQAKVFLDALKVMADRQRYGATWRRTGWMGALLNVDRKCGRLMAEFWNSNKLQTRESDDAIDLLNYAAFFIRLLQEGKERSDA